LTLGFSVSEPLIPGKDVKGALAFIRERGEFVVNIPTEQLIDELVLTSIEYAPDVDEFDAAAPTATACERITAPRIGEAPVSFGGTGGADPARRSCASRARLRPWDRDAGPITGSRYRNARPAGSRKGPVPGMSANRALLILRVGPTLLVVVTRDVGKAGTWITAPPPEKPECSAGARRLGRHSVPIVPGHKIAGVVRRGEVLSVPL
jgi:hypothetical protein